MMDDAVGDTMMAFLKMLGLILTHYDKILGRIRMLSMMMTTIIVVKKIKESGQPWC